MLLSRATTSLLSLLSAFEIASLVCPYKYNGVVHVPTERREKEQVGRKSSAQDKGQGALEKAKGKAKEATGAVTGDKEKKAEGRTEQTKGTAKDKLSKAKDLLK